MGRFSVRCYLVLLSATTFWICCLGMAPLALAFGHDEGLWLYFFFKPLCHQLPERSFALLGYPLAVCHRCFGIYFGFWLGVLLLPVTRAWSAWIEARPRLALVFAIPMLIDVIWGGTAATRFATGMLGAFPFSSLVWLALRQFTQRLSLSVRKRT